ncbi:unnamed protein product [Ilex paraguariensis]|uniref:Uncharacterized protein n=1 Tax=Ilex paraguariensis TaxID=185542 RepID=A0ABC8USG4_9AQUA
MVDVWWWKFRGWISDLRSRMQKEWPTMACPSSDGLQFWAHEWNKHGTCSESVLDQHKYFAAALNLKNQVNLLQGLSMESIKDAIKGATGYSPWIACNVDPSGDTQLYQIYQCVDTSGSNLIECPVLRHGSAVHCKQNSAMLTKAETQIAHTSCPDTKSKPSPVHDLSNTDCCPANSPNLDLHLPAAKKLICIYELITQLLQPAAKHKFHLTINISTPVAILKNTPAQKSSTSSSYSHNPVTMPLTSSLNFIPSRHQFIQLHSFYQTLSSFSI